MKRSRSRSALLIGLAIMTMSSCSAFRAQSGVAVKPVPVSLVFGAKIPKASSPPPAPAIDPGIGIDLPEPSVPPPPPVPRCKQNPYAPGCPKYNICPTPTEIAARDPSVADVHPGEHEVTEGNYLFAHFGNFSNEPEEAIFANDQVSNFLLQGTGYNYEYFNYFNGVTLRFEIHPTPNPEDTASNPSPDQPGFFLKAIYWPPADKSATPYKFAPASPIKLMSYPINPGDVIEDAQTDTTGKRPTGQNDPTGQPLLQPSVNTLHSHVEVGAVENVEVCSEYASAWKATWTLNITGEFTGTMTGTFWFDTAYGGLPVKSSYVMSDDSNNLLSGNFANNLMRLDPTDLI